MLFPSTPRGILPASVPAQRNGLVPVLLLWHGGKAACALPSWQGVPSLLVADTGLLFGRIMCLSELFIKHLGLYSRLLVLALPVWALRGECWCPPGRETFRLLSPKKPMPASDFIFPEGWGCVCGVVSLPTSCPPA